MFGSDIYLELVSQMGKMGEDGDKEFCHHGVFSFTGSDLAPLMNKIVFPIVQDTKEHETEGPTLAKFIGGQFCLTRIFPIVLRTITPPVKIVFAHSCVHDMILVRNHVVSHKGIDAIGNENPGTIVV